jgi:hypothetical protein
MVRYGLLLMAPHSALTLDRYPLLVDDDRAMLPWQMGRAEIIAFIKNRYGREFASYVAKDPVMILH